MVRPDDPRLVRRRALREVNTEMWDTLVAEGFTPTPEVAILTDKTQALQALASVQVHHTTREKKERTLPIAEFHVLDRTPSRAD